MTRAKGSSSRTSTNLVVRSKKPHPRKDGASKLCRRLPNLPHTYACSTIGPTRLNFRVRDGNGCDPRGMLTGKLGCGALREVRRSHLSAHTGGFSPEREWQTGATKLAFKNELHWACFHCNQLLNK